MKMDRFAHIVNENKDMRDQFVSELLQHTRELQKEVIRSKQPSLFSFYKTWMATQTGEAAGFLWYLAIPAVLIISMFAMSAVFSSILNDIRQTAHGTFETEDMPAMTILGWTIGNDGDECFTVRTMLHNYGAIESGCFDNAHDPLMIIRDLQHGRVQIQGSNLESSESTYTSTPPGESLE